MVTGAGVGFDGDGGDGGDGDDGAPAGVADALGAFVHAAATAARQAPYGLDVGSFLAAGAGAFGAGEGTSPLGPYLVLFM